MCLDSHQVMRGLGRGPALAPDRGLALSTLKRRQRRKVDQHGPPPLLLHAADLPLLARDLAVHGDHGPPRPLFGRPTRGGELEKEPRGDDHFFRLNDPSRGRAGSLGSLLQVGLGLRRQELVCGARTSGIAVHALHSIDERLNGSLGRAQILRRSTRGVTGREKQQTRDAKRTRGKPDAARRRGDKPCHRARLRIEVGPHHGDPYDRIP